MTAPTWLTEARLTELVNTAGRHHSGMWTAGPVRDAVVFLAADKAFQDAIIRERVEEAFTAPDFNDEHRRAMLRGLNVAPTEADRA